MNKFAATIKPIVVMFNDHTKCSIIVEVQMTKQVKKIALKPKLT